MTGVRHGSHAVLENGPAAPEARSRCAWLHHGPVSPSPRIQECRRDVRRPVAGSPRIIPGTVTVTIDNRNSACPDPASALPRWAQQRGKLGTVPGWANIPPHPQHQPGALLHGRHAGPPQSPPWSACKGNTVLGWIICRRTSKARRWPTSYRPSSNSTLRSWRQSIHHVVTAATDRWPLDSQSPIQA